MEIHKMKLMPQYFDYIKYGNKRIEIRLNDEKRKNLKINDIIIFEKLEDTEYLKTKIVNIYKYDSFSDLINDFDIKLLADVSITKEQLLKILNEIYEKEKQDKYGVLAIEIELI